jgi:hypothetical protein
MKKLTLVGIVLVFGLVLFSHPYTAEARARYGSFRVGGTNSHGKGSHYVGGYVRSCHGAGCL